jgi:hypothetical protein
MFKKEMGWAGGVAQVIEHLPGKHEALSSNPSTTKKTKIKEAIEHGGAGPLKCRSHCTRAWPVVHFSRDLGVSWDLGISAKMDSEG